MNFAKYTMSAALVVAMGSAGASAATIAAFSFDSLDSGNTAADISGNGHTLSWTDSSTNVSTSTDDPFSQAGNNSVLVKAGTTGTLANTTAINLNNNGANQATLEGWIKPTSLDSDVYMIQINGSNFAFQIGMANGGGAFGSISDGTFSHVYDPANFKLKANEWNYLALTANGGTLDLYIKNSQFPTLTHVGTNISGKLFPSSLDLPLITAGDSSATKDVLFDDVRISTGVLTDSELAYHSSLSVPEPASMALLGLGGLLLIQRKRRA